MMGELGVIKMCWKKRKNNIKMLGESIGVGEMMIRKIVK